MGNDGGSIPTRRELVKTGPRAPTSSELKATAHESLAHSWAHCALTDGPIVPSADLPLAADYLGRIFSYEAVLTALSTPSDSPPDGGDDNSPSNETPTVATAASFGIRTLRDIVRVYPAAPPPEAKEDVWICPISRKVLSAGTRAVFVVPCGHVFAEVALKEAGGDSCPECGATFESADDSVVLMLATGREELDRAKKRMARLRERGLTHSLKKDRVGGVSGGGGDKKRKKKRKERDGDKDGEEREAKAKAKRVVKDGVTEATEATKT